MKGDFMSKDNHKEIAIREKLIFQIQNHQLAEDEKLPSEYMLAEKYNVTRASIRNIYNSLKEMGLIYSKQGVGHFVQRKLGNIELLLKSGLSFSEKMRLQGVPCRTEYLLCNQVSNPNEILGKLKASEDEPIYCVGRLRFLNQIPAAIHFSYLSKTKFPSIEQDAPSITSIFDYYRQKGHQKFLITSTIINATFPTRQEIGWLKCGALVPLLVLSTECTDEDSGDVLESSRAVYRSDIFQYRLQF